MNQILVEKMTNSFTFHFHVPFRVLRCFAVFMFVWTFCATAFGQLVETEQVKDIVSRWKTYNQDHQEIRGWRIQIMATVDRRQMETLKRNFENLYPEYPVHTSHTEPYYQLRTGAFLTIQKAQAFLKKFQAEYPSAIAVTDNLKVEELLLYHQ